MKKKSKLVFVFLCLTVLLLIVNIVIILIFSFTNMNDKFYSSLEVAALSVSFLSLVASSFFSLAVYMQTLEQNKINESLPKKDDLYIIENYSLFNIEKEMSVFSVKDDELELLRKNNKYLYTNNPTAEITRLVFLPTDSINKPVYKVLVKRIDFLSSLNETIFEAKADQKIDCEFSSNILQRGYNCICVDILENEDVIFDLLNKTHHIDLQIDIISVFNVNMSTNFSIYLSEEKNNDNNPDKKIIKDMRTYIIHHSNYSIKNKEIV